MSCLSWSTVLGRRRYVATLRVAQPCFILLRKRPPFRDLNIERLPFNPLWGLTVVGRSDVLNGLSRAFAHATPLTLPNTVLLLLQTAALSHLEAKMTQNETTPLRHPFASRRFSVLERANAWSETAVPEGRQAEWNGARLRSKLKRGPVLRKWESR